MGLYDRPYYQDERPGRSFSSPGERTMVINLIIVNAVIFIFDELFLDGRLRYHMSVTSDTLRQPWQWWRFLTYGFSHHDTFHVLFNMMGLFFLGNDVESLYGRKAFLRLYLTSIVLCGVAWGLTETMLSQSNHNLIGASGAVTTVVILFALNFPRRTILFMMFIPMPAWVLGVIIVLLNLFGAAGQQVGQGGVRVAYDVHLVGALYGLLYYRTRWDFGRLAGSLSLKWPRPGRRLRVHRPRGNGNDELARQADAILEKLHRHGEASLTPKERRILEQYSRQMRGRR